ncbi:hypothetical protein A1OE_898 [Candidatus Endolissoclinum faulkneri L2]|uniref:Uncharacterized protein n=1 Tax=Candidatus Endolissoclinum faulkneri L2 TaxID=1193729 RepID=K7YNI4_9PROT|nr:hypothetical protein A1OE_898 [Candidatus Endolissoclinum faulkneri L2]
MLVAYLMMMILSFVGKEPEIITINSQTIGLIERIKLCPALVSFCC